MEDSTTLFMLAGIIISVVVVLIYLYVGVTIVNEWERLPILRFGRLTILEPGTHWVEPFFNRKLDPVPVNDNVTDLVMDDGASLQTKDNIPLSFTTVITTRIAPGRVRHYLTAVQDGDVAVESRALTAVAEIISGCNLEEILHKRESVCSCITALLQNRVGAWGVEVVAVELRNVQITDESIQEAIALAARAAKEVKAEQIRAEGQIAIAQELSRAAKELDAGGWKLKNLEVLLEMTRSAENNTLLIPTEALSSVASAAPIVRALAKQTN